VNSVVRKHLGIPTKKFLIAFQYMIPGVYNKMEFHLDFKKFGVTYNWIFPQKNIISAGTGYPASADRSPDSIKILRENFDAWCKERFDLKNARFEGFSINYDYRGFEFGNIYLAGDAAGFASGLTGEGIKPAILSGQDIARKIQDPNYECINIAKCLKTKKREDGILHLLIDKPWGDMIAPICSYLFDFDWFKKAIFKFL
jgi:geranylgeranyl reductase